jgi:hypothetical protein
MAAQTICFPGAPDGGRGKVVLVVDDEESILLAAEAILLRGGYSPITASGALEAFEKSRNFKGDIGLLLSDVMMPDMDGLTLAQRILAERPDTRILLMSAYTNVPPGVPLLTKPFRMAQLLEQVSTVINGPPPVLSYPFPYKVSSPLSDQAAAPASQSLALNWQNEP